MQVLGLLPNASNATLLAKLWNGDVEGLAVYKPRRGESPLWDFPPGTLCLREYAAWLVDRTLGWRIVPPTVLREGPAGFGAVQLFVEEVDWTDLRELFRSHEDDLRRMALFDLVINNADRKAGHLLVDGDGRLWGVDHGVSFHAEPKLRTVIWAFEGEPIPDALLSDLRCLRERFPGGLGEVLSPREAEALKVRVDALIRVARFPSPGSGRRSVPWPPW